MVREGKGTQCPLPTLLAQGEECMAAGNRGMCGSLGIPVPRGGGQASTPAWVERENPGDTKGSVADAGPTGVAPVGQGPPGGDRGLDRTPRPRAFTLRKSRSLRLVEQGAQFWETSSGLEPRGESLQRPKSLWSTSESPQDNSVWVP